MIGLIRIAAVILVFWLIAKFVKNTARKFFQSISVDGRKKPGQVADMVQDSVCGTYISINQAVTYEKNGGKQYFCSNECLEKHKKL